MQKCTLARKCKIRVDSVVVDERARSTRLFVAFLLLFVFCSFLLFLSFRVWLRLKYINLWCIFRPSSRFAHQIAQLRRNTSSKSIWVKNERVNTVKKIATKMSKLQIRKADGTLPNSNWRRPTVTDCRLTSFHAVVQCWNAGMESDAEEDKAAEAKPSIVWSDFSGKQRVILRKNCLPEWATAQ